jgi:MFS family permease
MDKCGFGRFQWFMLVFAGFSWMCDALEVMLLSFLGPAVECEWNLGPAQIGALTSVVFAGMCIGGPLWGCISDGFGRKTAFAMSVSCTTLFGFLSAAAHSYEALLVLRFFVGLGIPGACVSVSRAGCGGSHGGERGVVLAATVAVPCWRWSLPSVKSAVPTQIHPVTQPQFGMMMEFSPAKSRGFFMILIEAFWTFGTILQAGLAYGLLNTHGWWAAWSLAVLAVLLAADRAKPSLPE